MNDNMGKIWSFLDSGEIKKTKHDQVAKHRGYEVCCFAQLSDLIAKLNFYNTNLNLYFRGQTKDHKIGDRCETTLRPGAFREDKSPDKEASGEYLTGTLPKMAAALMEKLKCLPSWESRPHRLLMKRTWHFQEMQWAILQHYDCPTPLLDVTQSIEVACWFATHEYPTGEPSKGGYVYVLGLPNIHGHISFFAHDSIVMVKLQSACPPEAKRPHYQEGYLVGSIPHTPVSYTYPPRDVALRLVAKFRIGDTKAFWNSVGNSRLSASTLIPEKDQIKDIVEEIRLKM